MANNGIHGVIHLLFFHDWKLLESLSCMSCYSVVNYSTPLGSTKQRHRFLYIIFSLTVSYTAVVVHIHTTVVHIIAYMTLVVIAYLVNCRPSKLTIGY